jgi:hypothetical protein
MSPEIREKTDAGHLPRSNVAQTGEGAVLAELARVHQAFDGLEHSRERMALLAFELDAG